MRKFWWPWRVGTLDAADKEIVRSRLREVDFELKQIMSDVARVSVQKAQRSGPKPSLKSFSKADPAE